MNEWMAALHTWGQEPWPMNGSSAREGFGHGHMIGENRQLVTDEPVEFEK